MHGRKRNEYKKIKLDEKIQTKLAAKAKSWYVLQEELLKRRHHDNKNDNNNNNTLQLIEKAVAVNCDPLWLWNFRKKSIIIQQESASIKAAAAAAKDKEAEAEIIIINNERQLTQTALQNGNPKSYGTWNYRKWIIIGKFACHNSAALLILQEELELTRQLLKLDERNFHCWSYRRFLVSCLLSYNAKNNTNNNTGGEWKINDDDQVVYMGAQIVTTRMDDDNAVDSSEDKNPPPTTSSEAEQEEEEEEVAESLNDNTTNIQQNVLQILQTELDFTTEKIHDNFSNFSAFHYRSQLIPILDKLQKLILVNGSGDIDNTDNDIVSVNVSLQTELELVLNAIYTEPDDQTSWWYQTFLLEYYGSKSNRELVWKNYTEQIHELLLECPNSKWVHLGYYECIQHITTLDDLDDANNKQCRELLQKLIELDPDRRNRYRYLLKKTNIVQK